eukprot:gene16127-22271_t
MPCKSVQDYLQLFKSEIDIKNPRARPVDDLTRMTLGKEVGKDAVSPKSTRQSGISILRSSSFLGGPGTPLSGVDVTQLIQWVANNEQSFSQVSSVDGLCKLNPASVLQQRASGLTMSWGLDVRAYFQLLTSVAGELDSDKCLGGLTPTAELAEGPTISKPEAEILLWRGLRVRMGVHTGLGDSKDIEYNRITGRTEYLGESMAITKSVADAATGGMVTCTEATFRQVRASSLDVSMVIAHMGELSFASDSSMNVNVYLALAPEMLLRSAMMEPLRRCKQLSLGFLDAPYDDGAVAYLRIDTSAIARVNGEEMAKKLMKAVQPIVQSGLLEYRGYLLGFFGGVFLASFSSAGVAIKWALNMVTNLEARLDIKKLAGEGKLWSPADFTVSCGIDVGSFSSHINPSSGRIEHRGKVMNRAARISTVAQASMVYISSRTWETAVSELGAVLMTCSEFQLGQGRSSSLISPRVHASLIEGEEEGQSQTTGQSIHETAEKELISENSMPPVGEGNSTIRLEKISSVSSSSTEQYRVKTRPVTGVQLFDCIRNMRIEAILLGHFRLKGIEEDLKLMSVKGNGLLRELTVKGEGTVEIEVPACHKCFQSGRNS